jgi:hypothetical protein
MQAKLGFKPLFCRRAARVWTRCEGGKLISSASSRLTAEMASTYFDISDRRSAQGFRRLNDRSAAGIRLCDVLPMLTRSNY